MTTFEYLLIGVGVTFTCLHTDRLSQIREKLHRIALALEKLAEECSQ